MKSPYSGHDRGNARVIGRGVAVGAARVVISQPSTEPVQQAKDRPRAYEASGHGEREIRARLAAVERQAAARPSRALPPSPERAARESELPVDAGEPGRIARELRMLRHEVA